MSFAACGEARDIEFATTWKQRYIKAPVPPQRHALKPPRQLQPEVVHRLAFQLFCPAFTQIEMNILYIKRP